MERDEIINSLETNLISQFTSVTIKDRLKNFFGLPKSIQKEYINDHEQSSWRMLRYRMKNFQKQKHNSSFLVAPSTLLCATVFLEDAVNYQSIVHKITGKDLLIYRWFSSSIIKK